MPVTTSEVRTHIIEDFLAPPGAIPGARLPAIRALAERYLTSASTVSKAIENLAAEKMVVKKQGSGIYISSNIPSLPDAIQKKTIGFVVHSMTEPLGHRVLEGVEKIAAAQGYKLQVANSRFNPGTEEQIVRSMLAQGVSGLIIYPVARRQAGGEYLDEVRCKIPVVVTDLFQDAMNCSRVVFDNFDAGQKLTECLLESGRRNLLFITYSREHHHHSIKERLQGFQSAMRSAGLDCTDANLLECEMFLRESDTRLQQIFSDVDQALKSPCPPDAILCPTDFMAAALIRHLGAGGIRVPETVCVTGCDNAFFHKTIGPGKDFSMRWPTTDPDFNRMGEIAATMVVEMIEQKKYQMQTEKILPCPVLV